MANRLASRLVVLAVGLAAGLVWYASRFIGPGPTVDAVLLSQLTRAVVFTVVLGVAALAGFVIHDADDVRRSYPAVFAVFLLAGVLGVAVELAAVAVAPPAHVSIISTPLTAATLALRLAVPFALAGFAGAAVRALRPPTTA